MKYQDDDAGDDESRRRARTRRHLSLIAASSKLLTQSLVGNLVAEASIASMVPALGERLATFDRDFKKSIPARDLILLRQKNFYGGPMKRALFDPLAPRQSVSVTLNSDLHAKAKTMGINMSKVAEEAVAAEYVARYTASVALEIRQDLDAAQKYAQEHGSFSELMHDGRLPWIGM